MSLYARASDIISDQAAWAVGGGMDAAYPAANLGDHRPHTIVKQAAPGGAATFFTAQATFPTPRALQALVFINTNADQVQWSQSGGGSGSGSIDPTVTRDGLTLDPWVDLRGLPAAQRTSAVWNFAWFRNVGTALLTCGEVLLVENLRYLNVLHNGPVTTEGHPVIRQQTAGGVSWRYGYGYRRRGVTVTIMRQEMTEDVLALERDVQGDLRGWLFILDALKKDALYVELTNELALQWNDAETRLELELLELGKGIT
jgi:hypothetical protein